MGCGAGAKEKYTPPAEADAQNANAPKTDDAPKTVTTTPEDKSKAQTPHQEDKSKAQTADAPTSAPQTNTTTPDKEATFEPKEDKSKAQTADAPTSAPQTNTTTPGKEAPFEPKDSKKSVGFVEQSKDDDDDEDDEDMEMEMDDEEFEKQIEENRKSTCRKTRCAISAEVTTVPDDWQAPNNPKTEDQIGRLKKELETNFLFSSLEKEDLDQVIKAFLEFPVKAGEKVIEQGAEVLDGEPALFIIESGTLSVYKTGVEKAVYQYTTSGQYFGELALLYNAPRAATIVADQDCVLWALDRQTFNYVVKEAVCAASKRRMQFLDQVPLLENVSEDERMKLCDVMQVRTVQKDEYVFRQGDTEPLYLCILETGMCVAEKDDIEVMEYKPKDFFGELALLRKEPRATSIKASETSKVLCVSADCFRRICGSLEDRLQKAAERYAEEGAS